NCARSRKNFGVRCTSRLQGSAHGCRACYAVITNTMRFQGTYMCCPVFGDACCGFGMAFCAAEVSNGRVGIGWPLSSTIGCPFLLLSTLIPACVLTPASKVGTVCGSSASTGLCGGWLVTAIPTATDLSCFRDRLK